MELRGIEPLTSAVRLHAYPQKTPEAFIAAGIGYSLWKTQGEPEQDWPAGMRPDDPARSE